MGMTEPFTVELNTYLNVLRDFIPTIRRMEAHDQWLYGTDVLECWHSYISPVYLFGPEGEHGYDRLSTNRIPFRSAHDRALGAETWAPADHDGVQAQ